MKKRRTLQERPGEKQTCETDDPEEFSSFLDSFLCRKKMLRKNPPQRRRWNRPRQEDTDKDQYAAARARRKEGHDHQINLLRTASSEYSGLQLAQKKRKKKVAKAGNWQAQIDLDWNVPSSSGEKNHCTTKTMAQRLATADDGRRRCHDAARQTTATKKKNFERKWFFANFFSFSFPRKKELHPRRKIYCSSYGEGGGNVGRELRLGDSGVRWSLRPLGTKRTREKYMAKMWSKLLFFSK